MKTQSFVITGMTCANCVMRVDKALHDSDKILEASVNLATEKAKVVMQDDCDVETVIAAVRQAGYDAIVDDKAHREKILLLFCFVPFVNDFSLSVINLLLSENSYLSDLVRQSLVNDNKIS